MTAHPTTQLPSNALCCHPTDFTQVAICLHPQDDVAIAKVDLQPGTILSLPSLPVILSEAKNLLPSLQPIPSGHKFALRAIAAGEPVRRYGQVIGFASQAILPGEHVHTHNLKVAGNLSASNFDREYLFGADVRPVDVVPEAERRTFLGYRRADGRVGTRNTVAVISTVNCSAHAARQIAHHFTPQRLSAYPNVDGVIALTHHSGCSFRLGGPDHVFLQRTLAGMALHPNVGAYILVGLGCEVNQVSDLVANYLTPYSRTGDRPIAPTPYPGLIIQDLGGVLKTVQAGIAAVEALLPVANAVQRTPQPVSGLTLALQCGGSDSWSGVTANPAVGLMADELVRQGGTVLLAEVPEIYGAEQLLVRRAINRQVGEKLLALVRWWEEYAQQRGIEIDNNPTPGNKAGGLTTIYEKSLGAIAKGGSTPLAGVYDYAERVTARGLALMNTPGNDWVGVTGQVAGGCNLVVFTTGRGSAFGFKPAPAIKVCSNSATYARMVDDMDLDAGQVLAGTPMERVATELFDLVVAVASGQPSKSEAQDIGEEAFCPWELGGIL